MKFIAAKTVDDFIMLRYETIWPSGWQNILDIMQVFLNDIKDEIHLAQYILVAGTKGTDFSTITEGLLYKTDQLKEEKGGISLAGYSKVMDCPIRITLYNQLKIVDVQVRLINNDIREAFENNDRVLDNYMDSLEIKGYCRDAKRAGIELFKQFNLAAANENEELKAKVDTRFKNTCEDLGINPYNQETK